jgi:hypothetical protein
VSLALVGFPLLTALLTPVDFTALGLQALLAAAYGTTVALLRPRPLLAALLLAAVGSQLLLLAAVSVGPVGIVVAALGYLVAGAAVGLANRPDAMR